MRFPENLYVPLYSILNLVPNCPKHVAVAVSGGMDSSVLAIVTSNLRQTLEVDPVFFHINHGLNENSDNWAKKVQLLGNILDVPVYEKSISICKKGKYGIEAEARKERYRAFLELSNKINVKHILLGHHQDDQAETILLRLLRGTGLQGMRGMSSVSKRDNLFYLRPWLNVSREDIKNLMNLISKDLHQMIINDPSNYDPKYIRSALRTLVIPLLEKKWPSWKKTLCRHAKHMSEITEFIRECSDLDLKKLELSEDRKSFSLSQWRNLSSVKQTQVIRHWLDINHISMPSEKRLKNLICQMKQLHNLGFDRKMCVKHGSHQIVCRKGRICIIY